MTCKKFWQPKNCLRRECLAGSGRSRHSAPNPQLSRGTPRKQFEGGVEVAEEGLKRLFGHGGAAIEAIKRAHPCVIGVFKKGRPTPLVHVVAFSQHHLDGALRCIKDTLSRPAPRIDTRYVNLAAEIRKLPSVSREISLCQHRYPNTTIEFDEESEVLVIRGPVTQTKLACADIQMTLPEKSRRVVCGPAGVLIGSCGETVGTVRAMFNVDVTIDGDSAIITGWCCNVDKAFEWYQDLFDSHAERRERWAAIKAFKRSKRQCSESSVDSANSLSSALSEATVSREVTEWVW